MTTSGEMRATIPATMNDIDVLDKKITGRQDAYEAACETDRKVLRGEVDNLTSIAKRLEEKTDTGNAMIEPLREMFRGLWAQPKVQSAILATVLAALGLIGYKLNSLAQPPPQPTQIVVIPQQSTQPMRTADGGIPTSITFQ